jgi:Ca2+-binding EF-hand superfamily protein
MKRSAFRGASVASAVGLLFATGAFAGDTPHEGHAVPASAAAELQMMDTDKDGKLSPKEHSTGAKAMFDSMDVDKSAVVTAAEMDSAQKSAARSGQMPAGKMTSAEKIKVVDADGDGNLSAEEHASGARNMFAKMDADKDGALTLAELEAGRKLMLSSN